MKSIIKTYILVSLLLIGGMTVLLPDHAAALTDAQKKSCFNTWVGGYWSAGSSITPPAGTFDKVLTKKQANQFTASKCDKDNGGNCWWGIPAADGRNYAGEQIHCTASDGNDYIDGTYHRGGTPVPTGGSGPASDFNACTSDSNYEPDPALCGTPCKNADNCNLVTRYANPIINKFLAPLAILAVIIGIIWGAIVYITSAGDASKVAEGKNKIQKALFGLLAFVFLYALLNWLIPGGLL